MLSSVLWLTPAAGDLLASASKLLRGEVPCPASRFAEVLEKADAAECGGLLGDAGVRAAFVKRLKAKGAAEISDANAKALVETLQGVLEERLAEISTAAKALAPKLPKAKSLPDFATAASKLGVEPGEALKEDRFLWHAVGNKHDAKTVPAPKEALVKDRVALVAAAGGGPVARLAVALHILESAGAYIEWEKSMPGSKPPAAGIMVKKPFDEGMATKVAVRRVLSEAVPPDVAFDLAEAGTPVAGIAEALAKKAKIAQGHAVIPLWAAPAAPKDPKEKGKEKGEKAGKERDAVAPKSAKSGGGVGSVLRSTQLEELRWHLAYYCVRPRTGLSGGGGAVVQKASPKASPKAAPGGGGKVASPKASPKAQPVKAAGSKASAAPSKSPAGFASLWTGTGGELPPGHTPSSWLQRCPPSDGASFARTWAVTPTDLPPGHTPTSWSSPGHAVGSSAAPARAPASKPAKAEDAPAKKKGEAKAKAEPKKGEAKAKSSPKASPKAAPARDPPAAAGGGGDEAAIKALGDEIRDLKAKLKAEGLSGKQVDKNEEVAAKVAKLKELKTGAAAAPAAAAKEAKPADPAADRKAQLKKVIKEGGKRGVEIEGAADMGGLKFFCTSVDEPEGDLELLVESMNAMNAVCKPDEEERKGCSGHVGKMIFSAGNAQLGLVAYIPDAYKNDIDGKAWTEHVLKTQGGKFVKQEGKLCIGKVDANADKGVFPLKIKEPMITEAIAYLKGKGLFPDGGDSDDDELVFGDDDFPE